MVEIRSEYIIGLALLLAAYLQLVGWCGEGIVLLLPRIGPEGGRRS